MLGMSKSGNGYFFSYSSFSVGRLLVASLKDALFFSSHLGFPIIQASLASKMDIAFLVEFLENSIFLLNLAFSFFNSAKPTEVVQWLAIVSSLSCALVARFGKVRGLLIYRM